MQKVGGFMSIETKITDAAYVRAALPKRPKDANKSTFGRVLLVCGSGDMRGAAALSVLGALRCGAGLVTLASTREVIDALSQSIYEAMYFDIERGHFQLSDAEGNNSWEVDPQGPHARLLFRMTPAQIAAVIEGYMMHLPQ